MALICSTFQWKNNKKLPKKVKKPNIVLNNFVRNHDSYGQYLKNWPLIEREKLPIPPPLKFPHREGEKMVRQAIIGGRFL